MKFKATALAIALAGVAAAGTAQAGVLSDSASAFSYDQVGVSYAESEVDGSSNTADGFGLEGSLSVAPNFYVSAGLALAEDDLGDEATAVRLGAGYHRDLGLSIPTDLIAEVGVTAAKYDYSVVDAEDREFTWDAKLGARTSLGIQGLDATVYLGMDEKPDVDTTGGYEFGLVYGASANYFVTQEVSVGVSYEVQPDAVADEFDAEAVSFGAKYHF